MTTSSNGNIFRVTGHLRGEFTDPRWIPRTKASDESFDVFLDLRLNKRRVNKREAGDLRRYRPSYDVTVMEKSFICISLKQKQLQKYCISSVSYSDHTCRLQTDLDMPGKFQKFVL